MEITEVRIKLMDDTEDRLRGFCSITFDNCFVVRDLKIIDGSNGPFVAMPSRKLTSNCGKCRSKNHLKARHCNQCGTKLDSDAISYDQTGRAKLYADIAHPINAQCREMIQSRVIEELEKELELSKLPGYSSRYEDDYDIVNRQRGRKGSRKPTKSRSDAASTGADSKHEGPKSIETKHEKSDALKGPHRSDKDSRTESAGLEQNTDGKEGFGSGILD